VALIEADRLIATWECEANDLDYLTLEMVTPEAMQLTAYANLNLALKKKIVSAVDSIVGFAYDGMSGGSPLLMPMSNSLPWIDPAVTARAFFENVPFKYNRGAAAARAVELAEAMANGQPTTIDQFAPSGTDSGRFVSLAIYAGGLPMTVAPNESDCLTSLTTLPLQSWCAKSIGAQYEGNKTWLVHNSNTDGEGDPIDLYQDNRLIGYLLGNANSLGEGITTFPAGVYESCSVEEVIGTPAELRTDGTPSISIFNNSFRLPTTTSPIYDVYGNAGLPSRISAVMSRLGSFDIGDYVFTGGVDEHGFIITDKAPMTRCDTNEQISSQEVFWVADLRGLQVGTPRPFYCSRLADPETNEFFNARWWYFVKVPDLMWVNFKRIYKNAPF
jgi:hypothetical protein